MRLPVAEDIAADNVLLEGFEFLADQLGAEGPRR